MSPRIGVRGRLATARRPARRNGHVDGGADLAPGVKDCNEADLGAQMLWVGRDHAQRLGGCLEQNGVDDGLVLESDRRDRRGQGEDDMEIGHRQELGLAGGKPFRPRLPLALRAMPVAAGIIGDTDQSARGAAF